MDADRLRMLLDVTVITSKLGSIAEAGKNLSNLQSLIKDKPVPRKNVGQTMAGLLKRNGSKKGESAGEAVEEGSEGKDKDEGDADEEGESLGIVPADQEAKPAEEDNEAGAAKDPESEAAAIPSPPEKDTKVSADVGAPPTPPKDTAALRSPSGDEPDGQDEATTADVLTAAPTSKDDLPVPPIEPVDDTAETGEERDTAPPPPPDKEVAAVPERQPQESGEEKPEAPSKE